MLVQIKHLTFSMYIPMSLSAWPDLIHVQSLKTMALAGGCQMGIEQGSLCSTMQSKYPSMDDDGDDQSRQV